MKIQSPLKLVASILVSELAGIIGSFFTVSSVDSWYQFLIKPVGNPPSWVFGPVWITLYALMGISFYLIWISKADKITKQTAVIVFGGQLLLNAFWSIVFFGARNPFYALINIILLWIAILITMFWFRKISRPAFLLLVPYILWVTYASYLNLGILMLN